jgi:beta-lactamase class A
MVNPVRRRFLQLASALPFGWRASAEAKSAAYATTTDRLAALESSFGGRLGVCALRADGALAVGYRGIERFPMCSTAKVLLVGAILHRSERDSRLMSQRIDFAADFLVTYSPVTAQRVGTGMTAHELCAAAITYSDNTAANLLMRLIGGPAAVTRYARSIGDRHFRLDRWETALNSAVPGDARDTTTPDAMAHTLRRLVLGDALAPMQRTQLQQWLSANTTGDTRIRAGVPAGWIVGDKTGTGAYGSTNDIAVVWPPARPALVMAIYSTQQVANAPPRADVVAAAASIVADWVLRE